MTIDWQRKYAGRTPLGRFMSKVSVDAKTGCWPWTGAKTDMGYASFRVLGKTYYGHRHMFELWYGVMPLGLDLDHICKNTACVNPEHLEPVEHRENLLRGESPMAKLARATHCKYGHEWTQENTGPGPKGSRRCRTCARIRARAERLRRK